jgi:DNA-binding transcriptional LysR family regulator
VDLGVVSLPLPASLTDTRSKSAERVRSEALCGQRDVLICPPTHALAGRRSLTLSELVREPLVLLDRSTSTRSLIEQQFFALGVRPKVVMEMSSVEVIKRLVELGFGLSVIPELAVLRELAQGTLRALRLPKGWPKRQVGLVTRADGSLSHAARAFVSVLRGELPRPATVRT